ncbi:serine hydrolase [Streptomyces sp. M10(2022)]
MTRSSACSSKGDRATGPRGDHEPDHRAARSRPDPLPGARRPRPAGPAVRGYHGIRVGPVYFWTDVLAFEPSIFSTAGAMISTMEDLTTFYDALLGGNVLSPAGLAEMKSTITVEPNVGYGLGLIKQSLPCGGEAWGHNGMVPGYYTQTAVTEDGRHASIVTNAHLITNIPAKQMQQLLMSALCENRS